MNLKKSYKKASGYTPISKIGECSLKKLEFGIIELEDGESAEYETGNKETAFIILEGHCTVAFDGQVWENIGNRKTVFDNKRAVSFYMPIGQKLTVTGNGHVKIAVCGAIISEKTEPQLLPEEHVVLKRLGIQPWERETSFIIDGNSHAKALTVGECYVTPGNWAGFPPHKHDTDNMPEECIAEEIYYFLFDPKEGFGVQCVYTSDGSVDEAYRVKNDELVEFPYGYHAAVSTPGYATYFLWLMAGDYQGFNRSLDPEHAWVAELEKK